MEIVFFILIVSKCGDERFCDFWLWEVCKVVEDFLILGGMGLDLNFYFVLCVENSVVDNVG